MSFPVLPTGPVNIYNLLIITAASSFGTIIGAGFIYLWKNFVFSDKIQATVISVLLLSFLTLQIYWKREFKRSRPKTDSKTKVLTKTLNFQSGLHRLEAKYLEKSTVEDDPFCQAVTERNRLLGLSQLTDGGLEEEFYKSVYGKCCESVIGSIWIPVGVVGPLPLIDNEHKLRSVYVPLATVEGALVASINRGCKALRKSHEQSPLNLSCIVSNEPRKGMTRGPSFRAVSIEAAASFLNALHDPNRFREWANIFDSSSPGGHVKLLEIRGRQLGHLVFVRLRSDTSEAMGMNMISRGCQVFFENILKWPEFKDIKMESISGNFCVDKKPASINWIEGRGREVIASVKLSRDLTKEVFGIEDLDSLEKLNISKNLIGSAASGSIGGFNAHVANVVAAVYLSTGQDVAQVVDAAQAMTLIEFDRERDELIASLTMPCVEIGIRGGGTGLPHQNHYLKMIIGESTNGVDDLAKCICLVALAGELSLLASLQAGTLVSSHFKLNH